MVVEFSHKLNLIKELGEQWQVNFAPNKTQAMVVSRSTTALHEMEGRVWFGDTALPLEDHIRILGVDVDRKLRFGLHLQTIARQASLRVSALRRIASFLDSRRILLLYKAQIRPYLEYAALSWMSMHPRI